MDVCSHKLSWLSLKQGLKSQTPSAARQWERTKAPLLPRKEPGSDKGRIVIQLQPSAKLHSPADENRSHRSLTVEFTIPYRQ